MSERRRSIARVVALQGKAKTIAEFRLAAATATQAGIVAAREQLQAFIDSAELTGAMAVLAARQTRDLAAREIQAEQRRLVLAQARQAAETRLKLAERVGEAIGRDEQAADDRRALERLIEEAVARDPPDGREP